MEDFVLDFRVCAFKSLCKGLLIKVAENLLNGSVVQLCDIVKIENTLVQAVFENRAVAAESINRVRRKALFSRLGLHHP